MILPPVTPIESPPKHVPPYDLADLVQTLHQIDPCHAACYRLNSDKGASTLYADLFRSSIRYIPEAKAWYVYDGMRWIRDHDSVTVMELARGMSNALDLYAASIPDDLARTAYLRQALALHPYKARTTMIADARSLCCASMSDFDNDPHLLNCGNGTINLRTMAVHDHTPTDYITRLVNADYNPDAKYDRFVQFVEEITNGDKDKARYLQKAFGYCLSGDANLECLFVLYGASTRNGKSTLVETVLRVMGDYGCAVSPETIAKQHNPSSRAPSEDLARLHGIRYASVSEPPSSMALNASLVKTITGGDTITARYLHQNSFDYRPQYAMYINTNHLPVITDMTLFEGDRIVVIPFERHFADHEQDKSLKSQFLADNAKSAVLNWLIEGYDALRTEGLAPPPSVKNAIRTYYHDSNLVYQFFEQKLYQSPNCRIKTAELYTHYREWCNNCGYNAENYKVFFRQIKLIGSVERRHLYGESGTTTYLMGYGIDER